MGQVHPIRFNMSTEVATSSQLPIMMGTQSQIQVNIGAFNESISKKPHFLGVTQVACNMRL